MVSFHIIEEGVSMSERPFDLLSLGELLLLFLIGK